MLQTIRRPASLLLRPALRSLSCCASVETGSEGLEAPRPGTVTEYDAHVLIELPRAAGGGGGALPPGAAWPELVEREPAVVAAFAAVAQYRAQIGGVVKVTAFEGLAEGQQQASGPPPGSCNLLAFPAGVRWDGLPVEQVGLAVALATSDDPARLPLRAAERKALDARSAPVPDLTLLVCCHAARDVRCAMAGPPLAAALQRLLRQRGLAGTVQVLATSHIGGHKYAGNVVCYGAVHPCDGDWFGGVSAANAADFLDALLAVELGVDGGAEDAALRLFWRGRMGLAKAEQLELFEQGGAIEDLVELGSDADDVGGLEGLLQQRQARE